MTLKLNKAYLSLATHHRNIDESAGVLNSLLRSALGGLLLLLGFDLKVSGKKLVSFHVISFAHLYVDLGPPALGLHRLC